MLCFAHEVIYVVFLPQSLELLLAKGQLVPDFLGSHGDLGLHLDKVVVFGVLLRLQVLVQEGADGQGTPVNTLFELLGLVQLLRELFAL